MSDNDSEMEDLIDAFFDFTRFNEPHEPYKISRIENIVPKVNVNKPQTMERDGGGLEYVSSCLSSIQQSVTEVSSLISWQATTY